MFFLLLLTSLNKNLLFQNLDKRWLWRARIPSNVLHSVLHLDVILHLTILRDVFSFLIKFVLRLHKFCNYVVLDILCLNSFLMLIDVVIPGYLVSFVFLQFSILFAVFTVTVISFIAVIK